MSEDRSSGQGGRTWLERLLGALSSDSDEPSSRDELLAFLRQAASRLKLEQDAMMIIEGALQISDQQVREVLIPRSQVTAIGLDQPLEEYLPVILETGHSRYPVIGENLDEVKGILLAKDLLPLLQKGQEGSRPFRLEEVVRPALFVPESKRLNSLLKEFQDTHNHMAVVVDEYGGTAGIVTIEDILEEIVGEFTTDVAGMEQEIHRQEDGSHLIEGTANIRDINKTLGWQLPTDGPKTLNGLILEHLEAFPDGPACLQVGSVRMEILEVRDNLITAARCWQVARRR